MRIGTYNAEFGHPQARHASMIWWRFQHLQLDVLCLTEARDYAHELEKKAETHKGRVLVKHNKRGSDQQVILIRQGLDVDDVWSITAGLPYRMAGGGTMAAEQPLCAIIAGVLVICRHAPVEAWVADGHGARRWIGAVARLAAYARSQRRIVKVFQRHPHLPVAVFGDHNATPDTRGRWSPNWMRKQVGGQFARPHKSTGHGEIDFGIVRGLTVRSCTVDPDPLRQPHSDHKLVWAEVLTQ